MAATSASRSHVFHTVCALSVGGYSSFDLIIPAERGLGFAGLLELCARHGFDGVNVTYPYNEEAAALDPVGDPVVVGMGSSNTIRFTPEGPRAFNTDCSGFVAAFRARFGSAGPERMLVIGAGGVGRAVTAQYPGVGGRMDDLFGSEGVDNCTPLAMVGQPGSPLPDTVRGGMVWAFDAVYTPDRTEFRRHVEVLGAAFLSGYDRCFHQGVQAFEFFTGEKPDAIWVRSILTKGLAQG